MTFSDYIDYLHGKRIGVIGFGVSNQPLVRVLLRSGCDVTVCDRRERAQLSTAGDEAAAQGAKFALGADYLEHLDFDVIFRTPGVLPIVPQLRKAAQNGAILTSEMEAFCNLCPCRILAITGSDGKTTTSTITAELLRAQGHTVHLGGNIGTPLFDRIPDIRPEDFAVLELSSFQLHSMHCAPDVAIITNISPNHLDVHPDFEDYVSAKCSIYRGQRPDGVLVLNAKDAHTPRFAAEAPGHVRYFSSIGPVKNGVYCADDVIYRAHDGVAEKILNADEIRIPGAHNVENYMAAFAATDGLVGNASRTPSPVCRTAWSASASSTASRSSTIPSPRAPRARSRVCMRCRSRRSSFSAGTTSTSRLIRSATRSACMQRRRSLLVRRHSALLPPSAHRISMTRESCRSSRHRTSARRSRRPTASRSRAIS